MITKSLYFKSSKNIYLIITLHVLDVFYWIHRDQIGKFKKKKTKAIQVTKMHILF